MSRGGEGTRDAGALGGWAVVDNGGGGPTELRGAAKGARLSDGYLDSAPLGDLSGGGVTGVVGGDSGALLAA